MMGALPRPGRMAPQATGAQLPSGWLPPAVLAAALWLPGSVSLHVPSSSAAKRWRCLCQRCQTVAVHVCMCVCVQ
jgi:hypothetical protein